MKTELERYKEAYEMAMRELETSHIAYDSVAADCQAILNPPPEYEEVEESIGWVNIYPGRVVTNAHESKEKADNATRFNSLKRIACQEIKVKVQRPKPQMVEHSVTVPAYVNSLGHVQRGERDGRAPFESDLELHRMTVTLTATWLESPKEEK